MPEDYAITELRIALGALAREQRELKARVDGLVTPKGERERLAYQEASHWLRMVNTITWTLGSIFLAGAIIAINGASQNGVDPYWRAAAYILVVILCAVWWRVDFIYSQSAIKAREFLVSVERVWADADAFYRSQNDALSVKRRKHVALCIYLPIIAVGLVAGFLAIKTLYPMLSPMSWSQQVPETTKQQGVGVQPQQGPVAAEDELTSVG
jgi:hypothetical protein